MAVWKVLNALNTSGYTTIQTNGLDLPNRTILNFEGSPAWTITDDPGLQRTNVTIAAILDNLVSLVPADLAYIIGTGTEWATEFFPVPVFRGGTNATTASSALANLGGLPLAGGTMTGNLILNADPSTGLQAATKQYVDSVAAGLNPKESVYGASTSNLTATYNNGASGVGATLTNAGTQIQFTVDGIVPAPATGSRILIRAQSDATQNGIYTVTDQGSGATNWVLTRSTDFDTSAEISAGDYTIVTYGDTYSSFLFVMTSQTPLTIGSNPITWSAFNTAANLNVGFGLNKVGNTIAVNNPQFLQAANDLSDVNSASTARTNLGLGTAAVQNTSFFLQVANNLSDLANTSTARTNLGVAIGTNVQAWNATLDQISAGTWVGMTSLTTLGTITTGTWNGTLISPIYGGTGVNNGSSTITLGGNLTTSGANALTLTTTGATNVTLPTSGTLFSSANGPLNALSTYNTNGLITQTAANTFTGRTVTGTSNRITVTNGDGVSGNPTLDISSAYVGQATITTLGTITSGTWNGTAIGTVYGGTGLTSYTQGDILYASASNTLASLAKDTNATRYLSNTGTSNNPAWAQVNLANGVTGNLPVTNLNSGTSASSSTYWRGDGTWVNPGTPIWDKISVVTASSSATVDFTGLSTTYNSYVVIISDLVGATNNATFNCRMSTDNGATYIATGYNYAVVTSSSGSVVGTGAGSSTSIILTSALGSAAGEGIRGGQVMIVSPAQSSLAQTAVAQFFSCATGFVYKNTNSSGNYGGNTTINAIRFLMSTGNITTGQFTLYGIRD